MRSSYHSAAFAPGVSRPMIPRLPQRSHLRPSMQRYLGVLRAEGFAGEIRTDLAIRLTLGTDNSIYQVLPDAAVFPKDLHDVQRLTTIAARPEFREVTLTARGAGTGTAGNSLNRGVTVDFSRHMTRILEINTQERWVRVEPGVVLDTLNAALRPMGFHFGPTVSTASRATLGGMIANDSAGKGSRVYGKTSDHILELTCALADGEIWKASRADATTLEKEAARPDRIGLIHRAVRSAVTAHRDQIRETFPATLPRFVSGYNLRQSLDESDGSILFPYLLAGSEGTLALVAEAKLRIVPLPAHTAVVALKYANFDDALGSARLIAPSNPLAIETMDEHLLELAKADEAYLPVRSFMESPGVEFRALNLVEYAGDSHAEVQERVKTLVRTLEPLLGEPGQPTGIHVCATKAEEQALWTIRKKSVGLLGRLPGARKPLPFVEDCAVPPERMQEFIRRFRAILDSEGLQYGMFGHVDAGVMHVRPALDLRDREDAARVRRLTSAIVALTAEFGGVLWGEHGKGFRSEFNPEYFGPDLYAAMCAVKRAFDPENRLNPGKMAAPEPRTVLLTIDQTTRGDSDRELSPEAHAHYSAAVSCNGNGDCYSVDRDYVMCPSAKITGDRVHSPKGRATVMREWLRQLSVQQVEPQRLIRRKATSNVFARIGATIAARLGADDFSHEVLDAMQGCLACKACATQCPVHVDVPAFRSEFLQAYHDRYLRPLRDHAIAGLESALPVAALAPRAANAVMTSRIGRGVAARSLGLVDPPALAVPTLKSLLRAEGVTPCDVSQLRGGETVIVQDAFTSFYQPRVVLAALRLGRLLGRPMRLLRYFPNGKPMHVRGFVRRFEALAARNTAVLNEASRCSTTLVGLDPAITLTYRDEYVTALGEDAVAFQVLLPQEWLMRELKSLQERARAATTPCMLLSHCTEAALHPAGAGQWRDIFAATGMTLRTQRSGCCGMCGAYGHEAMHLEESRGLFDLSWAEHLNRAAKQGEEALATGYSCQSQVSRVRGATLRHPLEALADHLEGVTAHGSSTIASP